MHLVLTAHPILVVYARHRGLSLRSEGGRSAHDLRVVHPIRLERVEAGEWGCKLLLAPTEELQDQGEHCSNKISVDNASIRLSERGQVRLTQTAFCVWMALRDGKTYK